MDKIVDRARALDGVSVVYTFDPHPRKVLQPDRAPQMLTTLEQKLALLEGMGVDYTIVEPFDREFARTSSERFVREFVHRRISPVEVYVGYDFHFGRDREGSMRLLTETGPRLGFSVTIISEVTVEGSDVNSTRIRELLARGDVGLARTLLGRPYTITGEIIDGDRRGRTIGFPTANVRSYNEVLPSAGVYAGRLRVLGDEAVSLPAVTNVGLRPTFGDQQGFMAEAHVIDFEGDLYGQGVELTFEHHLRPEHKFESVEALREQISLDVDRARSLLQSSPE